jgi:hypothetical protein
MKYIFVPIEIARSTNKKRFLVVYLLSQVDFFVCLKLRSRPFNIYIWIENVFLCIQACWRSQGPVVIHHSLTMCEKYCIILSCSLFPHISLFYCTFPPIFCIHIKLFDILVLTRIRLAPPLQSRSNHLFGINAGISCCVELVDSLTVNIK